MKPFTDSVGAIVFNASDAVPTDALVSCIAAALTCHRGAKGRRA
jgi:hypothetical protein